jgi:hypothetical protein
MSVREQLHRMVAELSDEGAERWLVETMGLDRLLPLREVARLTPAGRAAYFRIHPPYFDEEILADWDATDSAELSRLDA